MSQLSDIKELLAEVDEICVGLRSAYEKAKVDPSVTQISRVKVKSALEHLRSVLDYSAIDAYVHVYGRKPGKIYFPYAKNEALFNKQLAKHYSALRQRNMRIYQCISSVQPHACGSNWLVQLCSTANTNKHNNLTNQVKHTKDSVTVGNLVKLSGNSTVTFSNSTINGVQIGKDPSVPVVISDTMTNEEISAQLNPDNPYISVVRVAEEVRFEIDGTGRDALELIQESRSRISKYVDDIYSEVGC